MKINIAKSSGFCFGVRRAIDMCISLADAKEPVYVLGDIVHNEYVVRDLSQKGIKRTRSIKPVKKRSILVISAHGASRKIFDRAKSLGYRVVDATCPKVKDIYRIAKRLEKNNTIIIIGDKGHSEVKGIAGQLKNKPIVLESSGMLPVARLKKIKKAAVITQSTQSLDNIDRIMEELKEIIPKVKLYNTTCRTTAVRQKEIRSLTAENDVIFVVGSSASANTKRLYQIAKSLNKRTYWIASAADIKTGWLNGAQHIGIMAGASTPDIVVEEIAGVLNSLQKSST